MPREEKETQVFITNLPKNVTEEEVTDLFDRYGEIQKITIKPNYVFVTFEKKMEADEAIYAMNKYGYRGVNLIVEFARQNKNRNHSKKEDDVRSKDHKRIDKSRRHRSRSRDRNSRKQKKEIQERDSSTNKRKISRKRRGYKGSPDASSTNSIKSRSPQRSASVKRRHRRHSTDSSSSISRNR